MSQERTQSAGYNAFEKIIHGIKNTIHCGQLARVTSYDDKKHIADITPMMNLSNNATSAQLLDVPVAANCYQFDDWLKAVKSDFEKIDKYEANDKKMSTELADSVPDKPLMRIGAIVCFIVLDGDTDNWDGSNKNFKPNSIRSHDPNDAIIVGVIE